MGMHMGMHMGLREAYGGGSMDSVIPASNFWSGPGGDADVGTWPAPDCAMTSASERADAVFDANAAAQAALARLSPEQALMTNAPACPVTVEPPSLSNTMD